MRLCLLAPLLTLSFSAEAVSGQVAPIADHHQHLISPAVAALFGTGAGAPGLITGDDLVAMLDSGGIRQAAILSLAYIFGSPGRTVDDEYERVVAENDWTGGQAATHPGRLLAFCSFNPLRDYALPELERCAADRNLRHGIKLHFGNSDVQLDEQAHVERLQRVFRAANVHGMAIVVHLRASISQSRPYGADQARIFLEHVLPEAPDVPVQIAHLAGSGPDHDDPSVGAALAVFVDAVAEGDPRASRLWFDVTTVAAGDFAPGSAERLACRVRRLGIHRILYGSDAAAGGNLPPREGWAAFRRLPLTDEELATIAGNVAPYLR